MFTLIKFTLIKGYGSTLRARRSRVVERARGLFSAFVLVVLVGSVRMFAAEPSSLAECWSLRALISVSSLHVEITLSSEERARPRCYMWVQYAGLCFLDEVRTKRTNAAGLPNAYGQTPPPKSPVEMSNGFRAMCLCLASRNKD